MRKLRVLGLGCPILKYIYINVHLLPSESEQHEVYCCLGVLGKEYFGLVTD